MSVSPIVPRPRHARHKLSFIEQISQLAPIRLRHWAGLHVDKDSPGLEIIDGLLSVANVDVTVGAAVNVSKKCAHAVIEHAVDVSACMFCQCLLPEGPADCESRQARAAHVDSMSIARAPPQRREKVEGNSYAFVAVEFEAG